MFELKSIEIRPCYFKKRYVNENGSTIHKDNFGFYVIYCKNGTCDRTADLDKAFRIAEEYEKL